MKREYWVVLVNAALVVGIVVGYGIWGSEASRVAEPKAKVEDKEIKKGGTIPYL